MGCGEQMVREWEEALIRLANLDRGRWRSTQPSDLHQRDKWHGSDSKERRTKIDPRHSSLSSNKLPIASNQKQLIKYAIINSQKRHTIVENRPSIIWMSYVYARPSICLRLGKLIQHTQNASISFGNIPATFVTIGITLELIGPSVCGESLNLAILAQESTFTTPLSKPL